MRAHHVVVHRVGAVDGHVELRVRVQRRERDLEALRLLLRAHGRRNLRQPRGQPSGSGAAALGEVRTATISCSLPEASSSPTRSTAKYAVEPVPSPIFMPERT